MLNNISIDCIAFILDNKGMKSNTPFTPQALVQLKAQFSSPLWVYDADTIVQKIKALKSFDTIRFAQKANSNTHLLRLMKSHGVKVDAVSLGEIERAITAGFEVNEHTPDSIVFTADLLDHATLERVTSLGIAVNCGSIDMLDQIADVKKGHPVWLRINPGFGHGHSNKTNTGGEHSKHGIWHSQLPLALEKIKTLGLDLVGLHMHIGSGVDYSHLQEVCGAMVKLAVQVKSSGLDLHAISAGGGLSIPYQEGQATIDTEHYFQLWDTARKQVSELLGHSIELEIEPGRYLVAEAGVLLSEVRASKNQGQQHFVMVDAGFSDLVRPSMYGSHHDITVLPINTAGQLEDGFASFSAPVATTVATVVAGPLCESGDVFTQGDGGVVLTRELAPAKVGDIVVFHDAGAYGASMSSNYNTRPLIAEVLIENGQARLIRRKQTVAELIALEQV